MIRAVCDQLPADNVSTALLISHNTVMRNQHISCAIPTPIQALCAIYQYIV